MFVAVIFFSCVSVVNAREANPFYETEGWERKHAVKTGRGDDVSIQLMVDKIDFYSALENAIKDITTFPNVSAGCYLAGYALIAPMLNKSWTDKLKILLVSPLGKMLDAWGKPPQRLLMNPFQINWIGAYDECSNTKDAKYCLTPMKLGIPVSGIQLGGLYGSCFPKACTTRDVLSTLHFITTLNNYTKVITFDNVTPFYCDKPIEYSTGTIITIVIMCTILLMCLIGTLTEMGFASQFDNTIVSNSGNRNNGIDNNGGVFENVNRHVNKGEISGVQSMQITNATETNPEGARGTEGAGVLRFLTCFSLVKNTRAILSTHLPEGAIASINGIRVLSMTWVILGHYYAFGVFMAQPDNLVDTFKIIHRVTSLAIANAYVSVDSFFLLSGLLVGYLTLKRIDKKGMGIGDVLMFYLHRYIRLTPSLGLVILFFTNVFPMMTKGALGFALAQQPEMTRPCRDYWWSTLLYFNNFYPEESAKECIGWSWYLANDMQFYIIAPSILLLMVLIEKKFYRGPLYNFLMIMVMCAISAAITGIITGVYDLPALQTAISLPGNPRKAQGGMVMDRIYTKPYCRITPYLVGLFLGYLFSRNVTLNGRGSKKIATIGWIIAIVIGILVVYGPQKVFKENGTFFNNAENISYSAFYRLGWACAVAWVIYACHNKVGGLVNDLLSWKAWIPLSRLTYGTYLIHLLVIFFFSLGKESRAHYQDSVAVFEFISVMFVSYACAFILAVCVEYPVFNLEKIVFKR